MICILKEMDMNRYDYCVVIPGSEDLSVWCTDLELLPIIYWDIKKCFPNAELKSKDIFPNGETFGYVVEGLGKKYWEAAWWVTRFLCASSWEPVEQFKFRRLLPS
jgi:hypothetical protein